MAGKLSFRPITTDDFERLYQWRNAEHVSQWWDPPHPSRETIRQEFSTYIRPNYPVRAYIATLDNTPVGYIQAWQVKDFPDYKPYVPLEDKWTGIDVFIGEADYLNQGLGTRMMQAFIQDYVFSDATVRVCIIDPVPENAAAIRAYEKVGFRHIKSFSHDNKGVYLMRLSRDEFFRALRR